MLFIYNGNVFCLFVFCIFYYCFIFCWYLVYVVKKLFKLVVWLVIIFKWFGVVGSKWVYFNEYR